ncbi:MAG: hypothetical protein EB037_07060, partial [Actinobacteria bacterium]|nr:hypothetical protein [Actinomycetota bacterium]
MQPASSGAKESGGSSALKKWGPIGAIVAVVAIVAIIVVSSGGGDDGDESAPDTTEATADDTATSAPPGATSEWEYPLSFDQATELGIVDTIDWGSRCDVERGRLAVPDYFAPTCMAPFEGDNGGATGPGVTADEITIVHYMGPDSDPIINYITAAVKVDETNAQESETIEGFIEYYQTFYEFYGRTIKYIEYESTGLANDEVTARADAQRIVEDYEPFAVIGGPALTNAFADE